MSTVRRESTPSAILHLPEMAKEIHGQRGGGDEARLVVRCSLCRWEGWTAAPVSLMDLAELAARGVVHGKSVCVLNRCN